MPFLVQTKPRVLQIEKQKLIALEIRVLTVEINSL
jgi:hypothetical protein